MCVAASPVDLSPELKTLLAKHPAVPGIVAMLVDHDREAAIGVAGVRKFGRPELMTIDDQIHLGSDTKAMTAVLVGQLIERGKLSIDTPVLKIFPEFAGKMDPQMGTVTVSQLLQHTSGLPANLPWGTYATANDDVRAQRHAAVLRALSQPPAHPPGTAYAYSNTGFVLLGAVVEQISGKSWEDQIRAELFTPLKMPSAGFGPPGMIGGLDQPWGHVLQSGRPVAIQIDNPPIMGPAGRVHCSIRDWAKFVGCFESGDVPSLPGVSEKSMNSILTPGSTGDYGGGWIHTRRDWGGGPVLTHAGSNTMWYCVAWVSPKKHFATLVAVNVAGGDAPAVCDEVTGMLIKLEAEKK